MEKIIVLICALLGCLPLGHSFPSGAPEKHCTDMYPTGHGVDSQTRPSPFTLELQQHSYRPGASVTVTIHTQPGEAFKGLFLQARKASCKDEMTIGTFYISDPDLMLKSCAGSDGNVNNTAVSHNSRKMKTTKQVVWTNPHGGDVFFVATFVENVKTLWAGVKSEILHDETIVSRPAYGYCPMQTKMNMYPVKSSSTASLFNSFSGVTVISSMLMFARCL